MIIGASFFKQMIDIFSMVHKPTTIKNPQTNYILERVHRIVINMVCTANLDMQDTFEPEMINKTLSNVGWAICSAHHTVLGSLLGTEIFGISHTICC